MQNPEINPTPDEATDIQRALTLFDDQVSFEDLTSVSRSTLGDDCPEINTSLSFLAQEQLQMMQRTICLLKLVAGEESSGRKSSMLEGEFNLPARYRAECRLGEGGFGIVLRALDLHLNRWVAVKIPKLEVTLAPGLVARFLREAENVAQLDHPNIVPVLATDETLALPLIIYHFCDGPTLAQWLIERTEPVEPLLAVRIIALLADAVHHAHQHGILHRDLKPTNVLLERSQDISSPHSFADGPEYWTPRITDFGVAKVLSGAQESLTATGLMMGTIHYMAPEQLAAKRADIGWHSDVYSLGVMLFEILTTKRPYEGDNAATLLLQMRARDPNVRRMRPDASRDLEAVVCKALSLEQTARYTTAHDFAKDLRNILEYKPVEARPVSLFARLHRWTQGQPAIAALSMASIVLLLIACMMIAIYVREITQTVSVLEYNNSELTKARDESADLARQLRNQLYVSDMQKAWDSLIKHDPARYEQIIQKYDSTYRQHERKSELVNDSSPRPSDVTDLAYDYLRSHHRYLRSHHRDGKAVLNLRSPVYALALNDGHSVLAACGSDGTVRFISCSTDELIKQLPTAQGELYSVDFSPDGTKLATLGEHSSVCVWDVRSGTLLNRFQSTANRSHRILWLDSDRVIVCGSEPIIRIWMWRDGSEAGQLKAHTKGVEAIALSGHKDRLFSGGDDGLIFNWSLKTGQATQLRSTNTRVLDLAFIDHQDALLYGDNTGHVTAFAASANGRMITTGNARDSTRTVSALLPSGRVWAAGSNEGVIHLHEQHAQLNRPSGDAFSASWQAHTDRVYDLLFMPDEQWLYSAGKDGQVKKWPLVSANRFHLTNMPIDGVAEFDNEACIFSMKSDIYLWYPQRQSMRRLGRATDSRKIFVNKRTGLLITLSSQDLSLRGWQADLKGSSETLQPLWRQELAQTSSLTALAYDPTHNLIAQAEDKPKPSVVLRDAKTGKINQALFVPSQVSGAVYYGVAFHPSGNFLAVGFGKDVVVFNVVTGASQLLEGHSDSIPVLAFDNSGKYLASGDEARQVRLWEFDVTKLDSMGPLPLKRSLQLSGHLDEVNSVIFSPDGRSLLSTDRTGHTIFWKLSTGEMSLEIPNRVPVRHLSTWKGPFLYQVLEDSTIIADRIYPQMQE